MLSKMNIQRFNRAKYNGFTFIELVVAVTLLLVLSASAILVTIHFRKSGDRAVVQQDVSNAAIFISQNPGRFAEGNILYEQHDDTKLDEGFPGFQSSPKVVLRATGAPLCIEGFNETDDSAGYQETAWNINMKDKVLKRGLCGS